MNEVGFPREWTIVARLGIHVMWLTFGLVHLAAAVVGLFLLWWYQVPPARLATLLSSLPQLLFAQWSGLLGISAFGILLLYGFTLNQPIW